MMKKELLVKNLGRGSYRGAVSFMYGISQVLKQIKNRWYIAANATYSLIIQINDITNSASLHFRGNKLERFAVEFMGC